LEPCSESSAPTCLVQRYGPSDTGLKIEREGKVEVPAGAPFVVSRLRISGNTAFDEQVLHDLVKDAEGQSLNLAQVHALAERITNWYREHGYPLARAIVPAQVVRGGVVELQVVEARYGRIELDNRGEVGEPLLQRTLAGLQPGATIVQGPLDRALLLLSDLPGVSVAGTLKPGAEVGTSDLGVEVTGLRGCPAKHAWTTRAMPTPGVPGWVVS
jgi:hemolysin activation/secretion protein